MYNHGTQKSGAFPTGVPSPRTFPTMPLLKGPFLNNTVPDKGKCTKKDQDEVYSRECSMREKCVKTGTAPALRGAILYKIDEINKKDPNKAPCRT